ncbi:DUF3095 family protein [Thiosulfativibrio zosterae]|uniref:DUF3095 domain-containing protein n=1 Tax=Thiosulfativibrio zosterae TaxID=2675053 RepID=A0A6F8PJJ5_9GAMM|nr:DUF3095 family protein [Thiosulfativibrio zosterae]BBP42269.1 hypothetical protein THMIRHAT_00150 [Thiosulfativibrio zosterae]
MAFSFEETLPVFNNLSDTLATDAYHSLPQDWWIVITDVRGSTKAIAEGRYRDINAVGGSTIAALLNAVKPSKVPYVFGGDGASFCVPPELLPKIKRALRGCQELAQDGVQLELRVGLIPYKDLESPINICRYQAAPNLTQYFFMGGGMEEADAKIKANQHYHLDPNTEPKADFSGFECRWNEIPSQQEVTFSLLVKARCKTQAESLALYQMLIAETQRVLGDASQHHPLNTAGLNLSMNTQKLKVEAETKTQNKSRWAKWAMRQKIRLQNIIGNYWMEHQIEALEVHWGGYKQDLIQHSDYVKLDDTYRCVMSASQASINELLAWLEQLHQAGKLYYGCHQTHSAIITCLVEKTGQEHIHFVDSAEGGYAMAAKQLKAQILMRQ